MNQIVYIVDDEPVIRDALAWLMRSRGLPTRAFETARSFLEFEESMRPGRAACLLLDVRMPDMTGLELFDQLILQGRVDAMPVIFLTGHGDVPMAVDALKKGAFDFFEKPFNDNALVDRIIEALRVSAERATRGQSHAELQSRLDTLTEREREVMNLILAGKLNKIIADQLGISMRTVEVHRARIFAKMRVRTAVELAQLLRDATP